jgi:hypothetical protein
MTSQGPLKTGALAIARRAIVIDSTPEKGARKTVDTVEYFCAFTWCFLYYSNAFANKDQ